VDGTFLSNTSYTESQGFSFMQRLGKDLFNFRTTFIPNIFNMGVYMKTGWSMNLIKCYDKVIVFYSESLTGNLTLSLSIVIVILLVARLFKKIKPIIAPEPSSPFRSTTFWVLFFGLSGIIAITTNGTRMNHGAAHVSFVPIAALLLAMIYATVLRIRTAWVRFMVACGVILESLMVFSLKITVLSNLFISVNDLKFCDNIFVNFPIWQVYRVILLERLYVACAPFLLFLFLAGWLAWAVIFAKSLLLGSGTPPDGN
jgi:hypothetical protein